MAHYFLFPLKDASIFSKRNLRLRNTGHDEILEIEKSFESDLSTLELAPTKARSLIKFDFTEAFKFLNIDSSSLIDYKFILNLKTVQAKEVPLKYDILAHPISQSWEMGVGRKYDDFTTTGVSWKYRDSATVSGNLWTVSESLSDDSGGGTWWESGSIAVDNGSGSLIVTTGSYLMSQSFEFESSDIKMDVTPAVRAWSLNLIPNEGIILQHSGEPDEYDYMQLRFFSMDTNTVYSPYIDIQYKDSTINTGSLMPLSSSVNVVVVKNVQREYKAGSFVRFDVFSREKYPVKTFGKTSDYMVVKYLPQTSYFAIKDAESSEMIIDFDDFTQLSCDPNGNFFMLSMNGLAQERYYKILIKVIDNNGGITYYDSNAIFKITR
jgi:hypothetical protein